jgi:Rrf2 family protein
VQFSKSTGYALHALVHLAGANPGTNLGIRELAEFLGVSESYLSKVMSKLRQGGLVRSAPGVSGGYELARAAGNITFLAVIAIVEGSQPLYECARFEKHRHSLFRKQGARGPAARECLVQSVMNGADQAMQDYLRAHTIQWVLDNARLSKDANRRG